MSRPVTPFFLLPGAAVDPLLGRVRSCSTCREQWPWTPQFFKVVGRRQDGSPKMSAQCRACRRERAA